MNCLSWKRCRANQTLFTVMRSSYAVFLCVSAIYLFAARLLHAEDSPPCRIVSYEKHSFVVCEFDLRQYTLRVFWRQRDGQPYGSLRNIPRRDPLNNQPLVFATNGGMYRSDGSPVGLYVENGRELVNTDSTAGAGNFYLKPNGIFYVRGDTAGILETGRFLRQRPSADNATQSGPMLVIDHRIHPRFSPNNRSQKIRNGVGIVDSNRVIFAISNDPVTFNEFATFFRDNLHCSDALYLDGSISSIYAPSVQRTDNLWPLGPIIGVYARNWLRALPSGSVLH